MVSSFLKPSFPPEPFAESNRELIADIAAKCGFTGKTVPKRKQDMVISAGVDISSKVECHTRFGALAASCLVKQFSTESRNFREIILSFPAGEERVLFACAGIIPIAST